MSGARTLATAARVLTELRRDYRTTALLLAAPTVLVTLLRWVLSGRAQAFQGVGPALLVLFPFVVMFLTTSVAVLRERTSGTFERLLTTPLGKLDLLAGYALAFGIAAIVQAAIATTVSVIWLGLDVRAGVGWLAFIAILDALLGMALGLFLSAFARTEFQAVQFLPAVVFPQLLLCGLLVPRGAMPRVLELVSNVLPLSYAIDGVRRVTAQATIGADVTRDILVVAGCAVAAIALGAATLRRRSP